mgnify:CR=1 FL=1
MCGHQDSARSRANKSQTSQRSAYSDEIASDESTASNKSVVSIPSATAAEESVIALFQQQRSTAGREQVHDDDHDVPSQKGPKKLSDEALMNVA